MELSMTLTATGWSLCAFLRNHSFNLFTQFVLRKDWSCSIISIGVVFEMFNFQWSLATSSLAYDRLILMSIFTYERRAFLHLKCSFDLIEPRVVPKTLIFDYRLVYFWWHRMTSFISLWISNWAKFGISCLVFWIWIIWFQIIFISCTTHTHEVWVDVAELSAQNRRVIILWRIVVFLLLLHLKLAPDFIFGNFLLEFE